MENPLKRYLKGSKTTQTAFAERGEWRTATVNGWCQKTLPQIPDVRKIEALTGNQVTSSDWIKWHEYLTGADEIPA